MAQEAEERKKKKSNSSVKRKVSSNKKTKKQDKGTSKVDKKKSAKASKKSASVNSSKSSATSKKKISDKTSGKSNDKKIKKKALTNLEENVTDSKNEDKSTVKDNVKKNKDKVKCKFSLNKRFVFVIIFVVVLGALGFSSFKVYQYFKDTKKTKEIIDDINKEVEIKEDDSVYTEYTEVSEDSPYFSYMKMNMIDVDLSNLLSINSETKGWIQVSGTNINYPFVQYSDNDFYLTHTFDYSYNGNGWVFLDYRNDINNLGMNNVIYAHGLKNKTMFGTLRYTLNSSWFNNKDNRVVKMSTLGGNSLWQVFSVYHIENENDFIKVNFGSIPEFKNFINIIKSRSVFDFNTDVGAEDKILTLVSCYSDTEKVVLHAKLIKSN